MDGWKLIMIAKLSTDGTFHSRKWSCVWRPDVASGLYARSDWTSAANSAGNGWLLKICSMKSILIWKRMIVVATAMLMIAVVPLLASKGEKDVTPVKQPMLIARAYFITLEKRLEIFVTNSSSEQFRLRSISFVFGESLNPFEGTKSVVQSDAIIVSPGETYRLVTTLNTEIPDRVAIFDLEIGGRSQSRNEIELTFTRVGESLGGDDDE